ncbi:hypothetical protein WBG78_01475 [Chryseolinea sp. T2]|uniref:TolB family protein n=1 Tax=Chryseolinea sp. T2 TaxID=3129255 RepID=UPI003077830E
MKQFLLSILLVIQVAQVSAQPSTEIMLFDLKISGDNITATNGSNITRHPGAYDNQPFFHPEKSLLYYASADENGHTDIKVYDLNTRQTSYLRQTPEREYSPTVTPDKKYVSCIIQRDNGAQDLGKYPIDGGDAVVILNHLTVGYHAWVDNQTLFMFVLGEPITLRQYDLVSKKDTVRATNIGRSLHRIPGSDAVSFIQKTNDDHWTINRIDRQGNISLIGDALRGREDVAWTPNGHIIISDGKTLLAMRPGKTTWKEISISSPVFLKSVSRLAVSADGTKLALVIEE